MQGSHIVESLFITTPDSFDEASRTNTSFGLRPLEHAHDEEVVPKIGSLEFVRQASWAVAAIKLLYSNEKIRTIAKTPTTLANAIEALSCKLEFTYAPDTFQQKHRRGILAFKRPDSSGLWKFSDLKKKSCYVQNTYRQNVVSALRDLGLCYSESLRFNLMQLTDVGITLADCFLNKQVYDVKNILTYWICNDSEQKNKNYMEVLSPDYCSNGERDVLKQCLNVCVSSGENSDPEKRIRLIKLMRRIAMSENEPWIKLSQILRDEGVRGSLHAQQIENAIRFEKIKDCARALYNECTNFMIERNADSCSFTVLSEVKSVSEAFKNLQKAIVQYHTAAQCQLPEIGKTNLLITSAYKDIKSTLQYLVEHEGRALIHNGDGVMKGPLLKKDGFALVAETERKWGHPKLSQLYRLWRDCNGK